MRAAPLLLAVLAAVSFAAPALAQDGDSARLSKPAVEIGEQVRLTLEVVTPPGATVELDPAAPSWNGVEVVRTESQSAEPEGDAVRHRITVVVAAFTPGQLQFAPAVNVITGVDSTPRVLPPLPLEVAGTLGPNDPLELSPLPPPAAISGAESPLLRPVIAAGVVVALGVFFALGYYGINALVRRRAQPEPPPEAPLHPDLAGVSALLASDPVAAYRQLASVVRHHLRERYGFPAVALTARELERRMESEGVDRWHARLVGGLLENCDAVIYAGYRPALERREADLVMAHEIVEVEA